MHIPITVSNKKKKKKNPKELESLDKKINIKHLESLNNPKELESLNKTLKKKN